jgi:WD40 repeat protein
VVDLSWSPAHFLLSASVDCTVRLWHISVAECLRSFR